MRTSGSSEHTPASRPIDDTVRAGNKGSAQAGFEADLGEASRHAHGDDPGSSSQQAQPSTQADSKWRPEHPADVPIPAQERLGQLRRQSAHAADLTSRLAPLNPENPSHRNAIHREVDRAYRDPNASVYSLSQAYGTAHAAQRAAYRQSNPLNRLYQSQAQGGPTAQVMYHALDTTHNHQNAALMSEAISRHQPTSASVAAHAEGDRDTIRLHHHVLRSHAQTEPDRHEREWSGRASDSLSPRHPEEDQHTLENNMLDLGDGNGRRGPVPTYEGPEAAPPSYDKSTAASANPPLYTRHGS